MIVSTAPRRVRFRRAGPHRFHEAVSPSRPAGVHPM